MLDTKIHHAAADEAMIVAKKLASKAPSAGEYHTVAEINQKLDNKAWAGRSVYLEKPLLITDDDPPLQLQGQTALVGPYQHVSPRSFFQPNANNIIITKSRGKEWATSPILPYLGAAFVGHGIIYPDQRKHAEPYKYPPTISDANIPETDTSWASGFKVQDCIFLNPYRALNLPKVGRLEIGHVFGQPLRTGIHFGGLDSGVINDVHFWPYFTTSEPIMTYQYKYGQPFVFAKADWYRAYSLFSFGYAYGLRLYQPDWLSWGDTGPDVAIFGLEADACRVGLLCHGNSGTGHVAEIHGLKIAGNTHFVPSYHGQKTETFQVESADARITIFGLNANGSVNPIKWSRGYLQVHGGVHNGGTPQISGGHGFINGLHLRGGTDRYFSHNW